MKNWVPRNVNLCFCQWSEDNNNNNKIKLCKKFNIGNIDKQRLLKKKHSKASLMFCFEQNE